eukprot:TRINITY_DN928_c3_g1_i1.p1 TRINITY_DN928_c3_g1~~TRINITY_DN928_c3_g1_i1.p1  ORF type:complete len:670 (-),score=393.71 TRINITY_DN928_c3_g1_i1:152-2059(-)
MGNFKKKPSKRQPLKMKYKIEKKVREHHRKVRKEEKKNPHLRKRMRKDPGIPNLWPFKEQLLEQIKEHKEQEALELKEKKAERTKLKLQGPSADLESLVKDAQSRNREFEKEQKRQLLLSEKGIDFKNISEQSKKQFYREVKKVIEGSDVILEVLDARDPLGCRCKALEQQILQKYPNKKIIMVLNKIDLVPREIVLQWLKALRDEFPCIAFKCTTSSQRTNLGQSRAHALQAPKELLESTESLGANTLLNLLKNYSRSSEIKTSITVGIIGYPNVGKSSLINSLKRSKAVGVGASPGFTKIMQEIHLDKHIKLLDCPGVVFAEGEDEGAVALRNCVRVDKIVDPVKPVEEILKRCKSSQLMSIFSIPRFRDTIEFLSHIARQRGRLGPGGVPLYEDAAKIVINAWNFGEIPYFCLPPKRNTDVHVGAQIVSHFSKDFDLSTINMDDENSLLSSLHPLDRFSDGSFVTAKSNGADGDLGFVDQLSRLNLSGDDSEDEEDEDDEEDDEEDDDDEDDDEDDNGMVDEEEYTVPQLKKKAAVTKAASNKSKAKSYDSEDEINPKFNQDRKKMLKKMKRDVKRGKPWAVSAVDDDDEDDGEETVDVDADYSFATDFQAPSKSKKTSRKGKDDDQSSFLM